MPVAAIAALLLAPALLASLSGCARRDDPNKGDTPLEIILPQTTFEAGQDQAPYRIFSEYHISPGDVLDVLYHVDTHAQSGAFKLTVDQEVTVKFPTLPEMNETQVVRPDGAISLPYLGEVHVDGMTVEELTNELKLRYSKVLKAPELYIVVADFRKAINDFKTDLHTAPRGLSRLVTVRPDGYATFALVGDLYVTGSTIPEVAKILNEKYRSVLAGLSVDLFLETHSGALVYVLGEVNNPGAYKVLKPTPIMQALALAGSPLRHARLDQVVVVRRQGDQMVATRVDMTKTLELEDGAEVFFLQPDDIVYVPKRPLTRWAEVSRDIADLIFFRGWSLGASYGYDANNN